eukprot:scaffold331_cov243-Pinguiococcus_pyrenoidosus.AAC.12
MATKEFMDDMVSLATQNSVDPTASQVREQALTLIQAWATAFDGNLPIFGEYYQTLLRKGINFPAPEDGAAPIFTPKPSGDSKTEAPVVDKEAAFAKLDKDLLAVAEKIKLCRDILPDSKGISEDEVLAEVIGFLEACKPRMVTLVEAGMGGELSEQLLGKCLIVNDALLHTLEAEVKGTAVPQDELYKVLPEAGQPKGDSSEAKEVDLMAPAPVSNPFDMAPPTADGVAADMDRILGSDRANRPPVQNRQTMQPAAQSSEPDFLS